MAELTGYNNGYLDEQTKRTIRRAILKAVAIPGYQVPFAGREMPMPYGWGHRRHPDHRQRHWRSGCAGR
ncbi:Phosphonate metabolism protein PhnJ [Pantoea agglomerans]|uniref:Phosphonate metabolism protein PhnJ n=1 Tax=Enterobacter agglomerans TaxID=549 RepID=A0A379AF50_ENTAG|nr:Phosphonate metabolism protein PhnJ [Pantoea agglomerans]